MLPLVYALSWACALGFVGLGAGAVLGLGLSHEAAGLEGVETICAALGAIAGLCGGFAVASSTWASRRVHAVLMWLGGGLVVGCGISGAWLLVLAESKQGSGMLAGLDEFLLGLLCLAVAAIGVLSLLAGICGRLGDSRADPGQSAPQARASSSQRA